jgi:hypothetical protein
MAMANRKPAAVRSPALLGAGAGAGANEDACVTAPVGAVTQYALYHGQPPVVGRPAAVKYEAQSVRIFCRFQSRLIKISLAIMTQSNPDALLSGKPK